jgi:hypothetical protein
MLYDCLASANQSDGPTFANLTSAERRAGATHGIVKIPDVAAVMPAEYQSPHVVHPATLDACFHAVSTALLITTLADL